MANILIIGAGGVGRVVAHKCAQNQAVFKSICLASRSPGRCRRIQKEIGKGLKIETIDASQVAAVAALIRKLGADIVINAALPYQNLAIMEACLAGQAHYVDTAVAEAPAVSWSIPEDRYWYGPQWHYHEQFRQQGLTAVLSIGSDPGMVNVFCAYAAAELFDEIRAIDVMDVNVGESGHPFITNFNPEINLREVQNPAHSWEMGQWQGRDAFSVRRDFNFPEIGPADLFLMDHDELHSLYRHFPQAEYIRFWMGFTPRYRQYFDMLKALGLLSVEPVEVEVRDGSRQHVVPLKLLAALLPDPASQGSGYAGKSCIGCLFKGRKDGRDKEIFIYSTLSHQRACRETGAQAIAFSAGVPPVAAALLLANGEWQRPGVYNAEQLPPTPFLELLPPLGMKWLIREEN